MRPDRMGRDRQAWRRSAPFGCDGIGTAGPDGWVRSVEERICNERQARTRKTRKGSALNGYAGNRTAGSDRRRPARFRLARTGVGGPMRIGAELFNLNGGLK